MSEPMTNVEIENVLSSIRRLVSDDMRPAQRPVAPRVAADKLILTAALRVVENDGVDGTSSETLHDLMQEIGGRGGDDRSISSVVASVGAAMSTSAEWEPETGDALAAEPEWDTEAWAPPLSLEGDSDAVAGAAFFRHSGTSVWDQDGHDLAVEAAPTAAPARPAEDRMWGDFAEAEAVAELQRSNAPDMPDDGVAMFDPEEDTVLDEEMLRDLVRDIIREELQGGLGERITRNVRKLVRVEINRALAAREFD